MNATKIKNIVITAFVTMVLEGCGTLPVSDQGRWQCSSENNANSVSTRIFNKGYWDCINRIGQQEQNQQQQQAQDQYANSLRNRCTSFGFKQGTNEFANCVMKQQQQDSNNAAAARAQENAKPAYDPFRAPAIVPMGNNGLTPGNSGMNCTPDGRGGYNCR